MNLCLRPKAVAVALPNEDDAPPVVPEDSTLRGRAQDLHKQLSRMREPVVAPRDQLIINLDFDLTMVEESQTADDGALLNGLPNGHPLERPSKSPKQRVPDTPTAVSISTGGTATPASEPQGNKSPSSTSRKNGPRDTPASGATPTRRTEDGTPSSKRGYVQVKSIRSPQGLHWTHSRKCLEVLLTAEKGNRDGAYMTHEQRLRERLERLNLDMLNVMGDGNCQFRSVSNELYGTQEHHAAIRRQAVGHIVERREVFEAFLGEDFDQYVRQMARNCTWGDELTLRAVCDSFGIIVHVVTSEADHWYLTYEPEVRKVDREIFLTYIAPIHYNSIRRQSSLKTMALNVSRSFRRLGSGPLGAGTPLRTSGGALPGSTGPGSPSGLGAGAEAGGNGMGGRTSGSGAYEGRGR